MVAIHGRVCTSTTMRKAAASILLLVLMEWWCALGGARAEGGGKGGKWELLLNNSGVVAMHMTLTHRNTVIMFDQTSAGPSQYRLRPSGKRCDDRGYEPSCWAHSVEYDIATNTIRPLVIETDTWCSSGAFLGNGTLAQTGGFGNGSRKVRYFNPCSDRRCEWIESEKLLAANRWYATNHILPEEDRVVIVGGLDAFSYEFLPRSSEKEEGAFELPFLRRTRDRMVDKGNNLYPFVHVSSDGNLFIFANRDSILFDYHRHQVVKNFPRIPGDGARNYPSTGSSVMLPLEHEDGFRKVEVMVCGGAVARAPRAAKGGQFLDALSSCGRLVITDENPEWAMEEMPGPRVMNDMLILPTGHILIINGAKQGCAGWQMATTASYNPYLYEPKESLGNRFSVLNSTGIARMYHSSAIVLPDGRILVAGSNPYRLYTFGVAYPTELRVEAFTPYYMGRFFDDKRPWNLSIQCDHGSDGITYGEEFGVWFELERKPADVVEFYAYAPPFATHSLSMNQRMLKLECRSMVRDVSGRTHAVLKAPPSPVVAPSGYYLLTVVNGGIPSKSEWVRFIHE
ncbi:aldehyde oxidase GLOX-like [Phoenix dactylifera]|uniref:Aldehyde oxidase GLOX-like n=1 Tax=Phoenix dactylifera TaxID=42345 RepID=A0A8B7C8C2_PHODC|nr:aldehyde oxidase GLOX-like [Phoenix dactylifera]